MAQMFRPYMQPDPWSGGVANIFGSMMRSIPTAQELEYAEAQRRMIQDRAALYGIQRQREELGLQREREDRAAGDAAQRSWGELVGRLSGAPAGDQVGPPAPVAPLELYTQALPMVGRDPTKAARLTMGVSALGNQPITDEQAYALTVASGQLPSLNEGISLPQQQAMRQQDISADMDRARLQENAQIRSAQIRAAADRSQPRPDRMEIIKDPTTGLTYRTNLETGRAEPITLPGGQPLTIAPKRQTVEEEFKEFAIAQSMLDPLVGTERDPKTGAVTRGARLDPQLEQEIIRQAQAIARQQNLPLQDAIRTVYRRLSEANALEDTSAWYNPFSPTQYRLREGAAMPQIGGASRPSPVPTPQQAAPLPAASPPRPGDVVDGHQYLGGNLNDPKSWRQVEARM